MPHLQPIPKRFMLRHTERRALLFSGDILILILSLFVALLVWVSGDKSLRFSIEFLKNTPLWFFTLPLIWLLLISGLYDDKRAADWGETLRIITIVAVIA